MIIINEYICIYFGFTHSMNEVVGSAMSRASCLSNLIMMGAPSEQFPAWLDHVTSWYNALSDDEKNCVLDNLISISGVSKLLHLR